MRTGPDLDIDFLVGYPGIHELAFNVQLYEARNEHEYRSDRECGRLGEIDGPKDYARLFQTQFLLLKNLRELLEPLGTLRFETN